MLVRVGLFRPRLGAVVKAHCHGSAGTLEPPEPSLVLIGLLPVIPAALFAACSAVLGAVPKARLAAVHETLSGKRRWAVGRFLETEERIRARWLVWIATALLASCALLVSCGVSAWAAAGLSLGAFVPLALMLRAIGTGNADAHVSTWLLIAAPLDSLLLPLVDPWVALFAPLRRMGGARAALGPDIAGSEVEILVSEGEQRGAFDHEQSEMLRNVLDFGQTQIGELMVPRMQVTAIALATPVDELLKLVAQSEHSRYPVYREAIDNIVGILHLKDLFLFMSRTKSSNIVLEQLLRKAAFSPETQPASKVLEEMRAGGHHMSIVIDEYGGMSGIVTLEDLLEEIVGDIRDEYDDEDPPIVRLKNGAVLVDASVPIAELEREAGIELPDSGEYNSVGGFVVEELGCVPEAGTVFEHQGFRFTVRTADERRVSKVEIFPLMLQATG